MKFGVIMPGGYTVVPHTDGRKSQIHYQADALERLGHEVVRMSPWENYDLSGFDALHVVEGGLANMVGVFSRSPSIKRLGVAPFLDTMASGQLYRAATIVGSVHSRVLTLQGLFRRQSANCDIWFARSRDEVRLLVDGIGISEKKVKTILNGVNPPGPVDTEGVRRELGIEGDFVFHLSSFMQRRKNVVKLIEAVGPMGYPLIIAGSRDSGDCDDEVTRAAGRFNSVRLIGQLTAHQRDSLYAACRVFCLPSVYEGTGLAALEAASHGAAVVITGNGGPRDYFADLAEYVNPKSVTSIRDAVRTAWSKPKSQELKAHVLRDLTWDKSAQSLVEAYRSLE